MKTAQIVKCRRVFLRDIKKEVAMWNAGKLYIAQLTWPFWMLVQEGAR